MNADHGRRQRVLLVAYFATHYVELQRVACLLQGSADFEPVMMFAEPYRGYAEHASATLARGIRCLDANGDAFGEMDSVGGSSARPVEAMISPIAGRKLLAAVGSTVVVGTPLWVWRFWRMIRQARQILYRERVRLLVFAEDNVAYTTAHWIRAGHDIGIPSLIVPYTVANADEPAEAYWNRRDKHAEGVSARVFLSVRRQWAHVHRERRLLRLPIPQALAMEILGIAPPQPWLMNSGFADAVAVESERMAEYYRAAGLVTDRFTPTGSVADDDVARGIADGKSTRRRLLPTGSRAFILLALMPDQLELDRTEFESYPAMAEWIVSVLVSSGVGTVFVRPHPRDAGNDFGYLKAHGARITTADTASLIGAADLYVASASATIRWAIAAGRPVINYDVYRFNYTEYKGAPGVRTVQTRNEFERVVAEWARSFEATDHTFPKPNTEWGRLDGKSGTRLLDLIHRLVATAA
jgi:hypothetical protein